MPVIASKPTELDLLERRCIAVQLALTRDLDVMTLHEWTLLAKQCLFIRYLVRTGRLNGPMCETSPC